jgi:hypothetical protein
VNTYGFPFFAKLFYQKLVKYSSCEIRIQCLIFYANDETGETKARILAANEA